MDSEDPRDRFFDEFRHYPSFLVIIPHVPIRSANRGAVVIGLCLQYVDVKRTEQLRFKRYSPLHS